MIEVIAGLITLVLMLCVGLWMAVSTAMEARDRAETAEENLYIIRQANEDILHQITMENVE